MMFISLGMMIVIQYPWNRGSNGSKKTRIREYNCLGASKLWHQEGSL